jgi:hypothetical protein
MKLVYHLACGALLATESAATSFACSPPIYHEPLPVPPVPLAAPPSVTDAEVKSGQATLIFDAYRRGSEIGTEMFKAVFPLVAPESQTQYEHRISVLVHDNFQTMRVGESDAVFRARMQPSVEAALVAAKATELAAKQAHDKAIEQKRQTDALRMTNERAANLLLQQQNWNDSEYIFIAKVIATKYDNGKSHAKLKPVHWLKGKGEGKVFRLSGEPGYNDACFSVPYTGFSAAFSETGEFYIYFANSRRINAKTIGMELSQDQLLDERLIKAFEQVKAKNN